MIRIDILGLVTPYGENILIIIDRDRGVLPIRWHVITQIKDYVL